MFLRKMPQDFTSFILPKWLSRPWVPELFCLGGIHHIKIYFAVTQSLPYTP
ncbi:hypothetical protein HanRHA438_Chr10g0437021 [Helianthus annuus]|nr:hypothetical protein HanRHA438_Chr10g0437021 [Helianthus annuus]